MRQETSPANHEPPTGRWQPLDPVLAAIVSFVLPPLGQFLIGQRVKAAVLFVGFPFILGIIALVTAGFGVLLLPLYNILAALDAYVLAGRVRDGRAVGPWEFGVLVGDGVANSTDPSPPKAIRPALIGMTVAASLPLVLSLFFVATLGGHDMRSTPGLLVCLTIVLNGLIIAALWVGTTQRIYRAVTVACLVVAGGWLFLGVRLPFGITLLGTALSTAAAAWGCVVLRRPAVRAYFEPSGPAEQGDNKPYVPCDGGMPLRSLGVVGGIGAAVLVVAVVSGLNFGQASHSTFQVDRSGRDCPTVRRLAERRSRPGALGWRSAADGRHRPGT